MPAKPYLFEIAWEVCNKVGGIHTVITSKLPYTMGQFKDRYFAVGPYLSDTNPEFKPLPLPVQLQPVAQNLADQGVILHYGHWLTQSPTEVLLLDWKNLMPKRDEYKAHWWETYKLDTLGSDFYDIDQPLMWSLSVGLLLEAFADTVNEPILAQAHEWLSSGLFLHLGSHSQIKTVFTTHATVLGRALSSDGISIYGDPPSDPTAAAKAHGVLTKHQLERLAAQLSTVFTTVSKLTARECEAFLGRSVDVVVQNGIDPGAFPLYDQAALSRTLVRQKLHDFVSAYFFPAYRFDLEKTHYHFTMGRYEIANKGYDIYLEALGELNQTLKKQESSQTVVSFFLVPLGNPPLRPEVPRQITLYNRIMGRLRAQNQHAERRAYASLWGSGNPAKPLLTGFEPLIEQFGQINPSFSPYQLPADSPFFTLAEKAGLQNNAADPVKLIVMPIYLNGFDGIFNLPLYELILAFDLGVFPSLYEPWGYTPLETMALGIPAVTSNLSGFGQALPDTTGSFILDRQTGQNHLVDMLETSLQENASQWQLRRLAAYQTAQTFSWESAYHNYQTAYRQALPV